MPKIKGKPRVKRTTYLVSPLYDDPFIAIQRELKTSEAETLRLLVAESPRMVAMMSRSSLNISESDRKIVPSQSAIELVQADTPEVQVDSEAVKPLTRKKKTEPRKTGPAKEKHGINDYKLMVDAYNENKPVLWSAVRQPNDRLIKALNKLIIKYGGVDIAVANLKLALDWCKNSEFLCVQKWTLVILLTNDKLPQYADQQLDSLDRPEVAKVASELQSRLKPRTYQQQENDRLHGAAARAIASRSKPITSPQIVDAEFEEFEEF